MRYANTAIFLKVIGRQPMILYPDEGFKVTPGFCGR